MNKKSLKKGKKAVAIAKQTAIHGEWIATKEYNDVLNAINTLSLYATKGYAVKLHAELDELNRQMIDIEHYVEIVPIDNTKAKHISDSIKSIMQSRRNIQQQLQLINRIHECRSIDQLIDGHIELPSKTVEKTYTPRSDYGKKMEWA